MEYLQHLQLDGQNSLILGNLATSSNRSVRPEYGRCAELRRRDLLVSIMSVIGPIVVALVYIALCSLFAEPQRRNFNAIMIAGAAYLNGGFGIGEFAFTVMVTYCAYKGLRSYNFIGVGWLLHTGWDVLHHLYGDPIVPFAAGRRWGAPSATR
jgi:hypothetical protein